MSKRRHRIKRIMSLAEVQAVSPAMLRQLRLQGVLPPIAGGSTSAPGGGESGGGEGGTPPSDANADSDDDESDDDAADDDDDADDDESDSTTTRDKRTRSRRTRTTSKSGDSDDDDGYVRLPRSEIQRLRRETREANKKLQQHASEERARREKDMADQEKWKDLAESREERITELEGEVEALKMEGVKNQRKASIVKVAKRLNFEYPDDAHLFLEVEDMEDEQSIEAALKSVLQDRPRLKARRKGSGAPIPGESEDGDDKGELTKEMIEKMSPEEINKRWPEVQAFLRKQGAAAS